MSYLAEIIGYLAAFITTFAWVPQIMKIFFEKKAQGVSVLTNLLLAVGLSLWLAYGVLIGSWPVMVANSVALLFIFLIIGLKLYFEHSRLLK